MQRIKPTLLALFFAAMLAIPVAPVAAESNDDITDRFSFEEGEDNIPPGCYEFINEAARAQHNADVEADNEERVENGEEPLPLLGPNPCHAIAADMNGLDTPKIDVLILAPTSPTMERDMRIMRQAVEVWNDGIQWMAADMGLDWMAEGVEFHISMEPMDVMGGSESEFTTYPIVDPEIVIVLSNPVGGIGIGIDPAAFLFGLDGPCHGVANPFDHSAWEALPGYDSHHDGRTGTYVEDCDGAGGNICFAVNGAIDPHTETMDLFQAFDLITHEVGHCLTLGHVGDGAEPNWATVPIHDIMSYDAAPIRLSKCVSSLNVEGLAVVMSRYLDTNGDGFVDVSDEYFANDAQGIGDNRPFMVQQPFNHYYASPDRTAATCPQPDFSDEPFQEVQNFKPDAPERYAMHIDNLMDDQAAPQGYQTIAGMVSDVAPDVTWEGGLPVPNVFHEDARDDAAESYSEIYGLSADVTDEHLTVHVELEELYPVIYPNRIDNPLPAGPSGVNPGTLGTAQYGLEINDRIITLREGDARVVFGSDTATVTITLDREPMASHPQKPIVAPYDLRFYVLAPGGPEGTRADDYAPDLDQAPLRAGPTPELQPAPYVFLTVEGEQDIMVPIAEDGSWSGNVDLGMYEAGEVVNVTATWHTEMGTIIDGDVVRLVVDPSVPVDTDSVFNAAAGPGSANSDDPVRVPGFEAFVAVAVLLGAVALIRRRD